MIEIRDLGKCYYSPDEKWVVSDVSISIKEGEFTSIVGRSGSGKSTLLKMIGGLLRPDNGEVYIDGKNIFEMSDGEISDYRCNKIGFVFQDFFLEEKYTVYQNVEIVLMIAGVEGSRRKAMIMDALAKVKMEDKANDYVNVLSGGERQRVCIARAIVNNPDIILADEPCGNLDYQNGKNIMDILRQFVLEGKTVLLITHNNEDAAITDNIITINDGKVINIENKR